MGLGSAIGGAIGGAIGALGNYEGAKLSYKQQKKLLDQQQAFEREKALHAHQWEVQDLMDAGLNPILSAGGTGASMGSPSAPSAAMPDLATPLSAAAQRALEKTKIKNEKVMLDASAKQAEANAEKAKIEAAQQTAEFEANKPKLDAQKKYNESKVGKTLSYIGMGGRDLQPAAQIVGTAAGLWGAGRMATSAGKIAGELKKQNELSREQFKNWKAPNVFQPKKDEWIKQPTYKRGQMRY